MTETPDLERIVRELSRPQAFPDPVEAVRVEQTHISVVFLTGRHAYKIKKGLDLGFLDFTSLEKRRHFCHQEVALNRPRAPGVYLGVVPVTASEEGLVFDGPGEPVEWAVKMEQLPGDFTLRSRLGREALAQDELSRVARRIARLHGEADRGPEVARFGGFDTVAFNARENFQQSESQRGVTLTPEVFQRFRELTEGALARLEPVIEGRAARGMTRDTHGDLHLDHVYLFPERDPPRDLLIVDCIEFNDRFRYADPIADVGFLAMDLTYHGREDLARSLMETYFAESGDEEGRAVLPFYVAYRAAVRGKVEGFAVLQESLPPEVRDREQVRSQAHWMVGLGALEEARKRPCAVLVSGLPATGKSTLARRLEAEGVGRSISSDEVRKRLAGLEPTTSAKADFEQGLYAPDVTETTYRECLEEARRAVLQGNRVIVDATFRREAHRRMFLEGLRSVGVPVALLHCQADPTKVRGWIEERSNDPSDAYWEVYREMAETWEPFGEEVARASLSCRTDAPESEVVRQALAGLTALGLW